MASTLSCSPITLGGKRIEQRVAQALTTLVRYGRITITSDGRYLARKAA